MHFLFACLAFGLSGCESLPATDKATVKTRQVVSVNAVCSRKPAVKPAVLKIKAKDIKASRILA